MSTHYHAYQGRGFLFSTYEVQVEQWHQRFTDFDPARIASILHLDTDDTYLYLTYFNIRYRLRLADGVLEKENANGWTEDLFFNEAMSIYHHLYYTTDHPLLSGTWIPSADLEGLTNRNTRIPDPLLAPFAQKFTGRLKELREASAKLGGTPMDKGDFSCQFTSFPQIKLQLIFWDADEDFPAQAQILVDKRASDYMHKETIGCIVSDLLEMLEKELTT